MSTQANDGTAKGSARQYLLGQIGRRSFFNRLAALGITATAAQRYWELLASPQSGSTQGNPEGIGPSMIKEGTAGEILVEQLKRCGVRFIFFNPSSGDYPIFDAVLKRTDMQLIEALHEAILSGMADGYSKASKKIPFVTCARPGFPNTLTQMYNAYRDRTPVVYSIDQQSELGRGTWGVQEVEDITMATQPFTRWRWETRRADNIAADVRRAFKFAATPPTGPVFVAFPSDLLGAKQVKAEVIDQDYFDLSAEVRPSQSEVEEVARQLLGAASPVLYVGNEVERLGAEAEVVQVAELLSLPVVQEWYACNNSFPTDHPLYLGFYNNGMRYPGKIDFLLNLGGMLPYSAGPNPSIPRTTRIAEVRFDIDNMGRVFPTVLSSPSSVKLFARDLVEAVKSMATMEQLQKLREMRGAATEEFNRKIRASQERAAQNRWADVPISHERLALELRNALDPDAIVVHELDTGRICLGYLPFGEKKMGYYSNTGLALGWGVAAAMGVKLAAPDRQVVALEGDGAFLFGESQAFWTSKRYEIPIIVVIQNNGSYDGERNRIWSRDSLQAQMQKDMTCYIGDPEIHYTKLAEAYGIKTERVTDPNQLGPALKRAIQTTRDGQSYVLDVVMGRRGYGAELAWYPRYSLAAERKRRV
ncbi:MAG: thiamine pyrophosphate-binding protein [Acidobacteria bacterium]|nr:thiamine pyrophosphate-binding protein [Acidobacteriota bacterium]